MRHGSEFHCASECFDAGPMRCQPDVPLAEASREDSGVHADAVVAHIQRYVVAFVEQVQRNPVRIGVPGDVGEQFTCHAVQRRVDRMALRVVDRAVDGDTGALGEAVRQCLDGPASSSTDGCSSRVTCLKSSDTSTNNSLARSTPDLSPSARIASRRSCLAARTVCNAPSCRVSAILRRSRATARG
jgi:hypothetical protein